MRPTLRRAALSWFASNALAAVLSAQCTNPTPTPIPNQTLTSGSATITDNNALAADAFAVSGTAVVTFVAGNCIHLRNGFHATAGSANTFHAWVETAPAAVSVTPSSGSGTTSSFTWKAAS